MADVTEAQWNLAAFEAWWRHKATPEQRRKLREIAEDDGPLPRDLLTALSRRNVVIAGAYFVGIGESPTYHLPRGLQLFIQQQFCADDTSSTL